VTHVSKLEKWLEPRAMPVLAVMSVIVIGGSALAYFIRESDIARVERLERVIQCADSPECRRFIKRAIRDFLEHSGRPGHSAKKQLRQPGISFRFGTPSSSGAVPLLVEETPQPPFPRTAAAVSPHATSKTGEAPGSGEAVSATPRPPRDVAEPSEPAQSSPTQPTPPSSLPSAPKGKGPKSVELPELPPVVGKAVEITQETLCAVEQQVDELC